MYHPPVYSVQEKTEYQQHPYYPQDVEYKVCHRGTLGIYVSYECCEVGCDRCTNIFTQDDSCAVFESYPTVITQHYG